tara:strand:- start:132 stop:350 length:219 start_codon:yes stop_codon:yes gene_type:complete
MNLDDTAIAQIVKLIQMALLTGTDIVDHLRMMQLEVNDKNKIVLNTEYAEIFNEQIEKMIKASEQSLTQEEG